MDSTYEDNRINPEKLKGKRIGGKRGGRPPPLLRESRQVGFETLFVIRQAELFSDVSPMEFDCFFGDTK